MIESRQNLLNLAAIRIDDDRLAAVVGVQIAQNAALRIEQKGIRTVPGLPGRGYCS